MNIKNNPLIDQFISIYTSLGSDNVDDLNQVYATNIEFIDPLHRLVGLLEVKKYMHHMYANISDYHFDVLDCVQGNEVAFMNWKLRFRHPKLNGRKMIEFEGASRLDFNDKIFKHQDFYDLGAMLYEHIPVFGSLVRTIKVKAGQ